MKIDESGNVTLEIKVNVKGPMLEVEQRIQQALNDAGCKLTEHALEQFDTDGTPLMTGSIKWTRRIKDTRTYQTPYGAVKVNRNVYQTSKGGKTYVPLEIGARIVRSATPRFAMIVSNKYANLNAGAKGESRTFNQSRHATEYCRLRRGDCGSQGAQLDLRHTQA